jgi:ribosome maturation protein SDO1
VAKQEELEKAFETIDQTQICKIILEKGEVQVSEKERAVQLESTYKEVATTVANMCVDPESKRPYPVSVIEKALKDVHFSVKQNRSTKQQALEMIPILRESLPIARAKMRVRVSLPSHSAKMIKEKAEVLIPEIENENWAEGDLEMVGLIEPGVYRELEELVRKESKGQGKLELVSLKDVKMGEELLE